MQRHSARTRQCAALASLLLCAARPAVSVAEEPSLFTPTWATPQDGQAILQPLPSDSWNFVPNDFEVLPWPGEISWPQLPPLLLPPYPQHPGGVSSPSGPSTIDPHERAPLTWEVSSAASANNAFAFDLFAQLRGDREAGDNMLASPFSVSTALAMTYAGARGNTAAQMADVLRFDTIPGAGVHAAYGGWIGDLNTPREGYELRVANRLFGQQGFQFRDEFLTTVDDRYGAPLEQLDFINATEPARRHINDWVAEQTNDRIQDLLPQGSVDSNTRLVLTNALYFDGKWKYEFDEAATRPRSFFQTGAAEIQVDTMSQANRFRYGQFDGFQMLELPYAGDDLSMVVMLPDAVDGLAELESTMSAELFEASVGQLSSQMVNVFLPKFTFGDGASLAPALQALGMTDAFANGADFSGMSDANLAISDVYHETFIDVSESGTEAAAATAVVVTVSDAVAYHPPPAEFNADHPFLFGIRDQHTGGLLFLGRMADPAKAAAASVPEPGGAMLAVLGAAVLAYRIRKR